MTAPGANYVKLHFRLEIEDDWPPVGVEGLWAIDLGDGIVRLDNVPWFVPGVACGDVFLASADEEGLFWAGDVVRPSENCTIRLIVLRDKGSVAARQSVLDLFRDLGVRGEGVEQFRMVALDVPPTADLD
ncbi:DUF4265 domain-containing protein [Streptomyces sp. NBC_00370]|uniref:DUF4265 domain-containing protein n=1 Tax=Streptomyces sp. NBC_00370 TaxID=2975728 RepID=UPI002E26DEE4